MDEKIIIAACNIVLSKLRLNDPIDFKGSFPYWIRDNNKNEIFTEIILIPNDNFYNEVHGFLLDNGYIGRLSPRQEDKFLTEKGNKAKELKGIENYIKWETKQAKRQKIEWILSYLVIPIVTIATLIITVYSTCQSQPANNSTSNNVHSSPKINHP